VRSSLEADSFRRDEDERGLIDAGEVAQMLGMTVDWVYEQSRRGRIPTITLGRFRRYRRAAIEAWLLSIERGSVGAGR
jgi:excisionase family DNA binding protein